MQEDLILGFSLANSVTEILAMLGSKEVGFSKRLTYGYQITGDHRLYDRCEVQNGPHHMRHEMPDGVMAYIELSCCAKNFNEIKTLVEMNCTIVCRETNPLEE